MSIFVAVFAAIAAGTGAFWDDGGSPYSFTTVRGETIEVYGRGIYRYDSLLIASGNKGVDAVVLAVGIPLLLIAARAYRRGSLRGALLLSSILAYFLYVYATYSLGVAFNSLFLVYVAVFSASLYALALLLRSIDFESLSAQVSAKIPLKRVAALLFAIGSLALLAWLEAPVTALMQGRSPELHGTATLVTHALDLSIIVPAFFICGVLILRGSAVGYLMAFPLLGILAMLAPSVTVMTANQILSGVTLTVAEFIGLVIGFVILGLIAIWTIWTLLRNVPDPK